MFLIMASLLLGGIALIVTGIAQARGVVAPGSPVGLRIPSTLRSEGSWYAGQKASAPVLLLVGLIWVAMGIVIPFLDDEMLVYCLVAVVVFSLSLAVVGIVRGHRAAVGEDRNTGSA